MNNTTKHPMGEPDDHPDSKTPPRDPAAQARELLRSLESLDRRDADDAATADLARSLASLAMQVHPGAAMQGIASHSIVSKLRKAGYEKEVGELAQWLLRKPDAIERLLPADFPVVVLSRKPDHHYVPGYYGASHRKLPHLAELPVFGPLATHAMASGTTLLHLDRLFTLYSIVARLAATPAGQQGFSVVEAGVYQGGTSLFLASLLHELGLQHCTVHACDTFSGHDAADVVEGVDKHVPGHFGDTGVEAVKRLLLPFPNAHVHAGRIQDVADALPRPFGLVHLDTDLYEPTVFGLHYFFDKLVPGGAIVVDDYLSQSCPGILRAVEEFAAARPDAFILPLTTAQCVVGRSGGAA